MWRSKKAKVRSTWKWIIKVNVRECITEDIISKYFWVIISKSAVLRIEENIN